MSAAIWNGYPIVYSDTSSYLASGFHLETLVDRPITYGLFIRLCSLNGWSLWTVAIAQSMLLAYVLGSLLRGLGIANPWSRSFIIGGTALLTGLPFLCGQIITDVFTPILVITLFLLLFIEALPRRTRAVHFAIFLLAFAMHMSHVSITVLLLLFGLLLKWLLPRALPNMNGWRTIITLLLLSVAGTLVMGVSLAKSKYTFYAAHLAGTGVLQRYLEEHCATQHFQLCERLGNIPQSADAFLWADNSPLKIYTSRQEMETELGSIVAGSLQEPALLWMQIKSAMSASAQQLTRFAVGNGNGAFGEGTILHERIASFIPSEIAAFDNALQMKGVQFNGAVSVLVRFHDLVMGLALLVLALSWIFYRHRLQSTPYLASASLFLISAILVNASINASLVMVADRFGTKLAWAVPFLAIVTCVVLFKKGYKPIS
ncbi:MAG: hypothetical protein ACOH13_05360 [Flavobacteriales bacterium]